MGFFERDTKILSLDLTSKKPKEKKNNLIYNHFIFKWMLDTLEYKCPNATAIQYEHNVKMVQRKRQKAKMKHSDKNNIMLHHIMIPKMFGN